MPATRSAHEIYNFYGELTALHHNEFLPFPYGPISASFFISEALYMYQFEKIELSNYQEDVGNVPLLTKVTRWTGTDSNRSPE